MEKFYANIDEILVFIVTLTIIIILGKLIINFLRSKHLERKAIIESENIEFRDISIKEIRMLALKRGILFSSLGLGFVFAIILSEIFFGLDQFNFYVAILFTFGGLGQLLFYFITRNARE